MTITQTKPENNPHLKLHFNHRISPDGNGTRGTLVEWVGEYGKLLEEHGIPTRYYLNSRANQSLANTAAGTIELLIERGDFESIRARVDGFVEVPKTRSKRKKK